MDMTNEITKPTDADDEVEAAVERLRAEREAAGPGQFDAGHAAGRRWGLRSASLSDFQRLEAIDDAPATLHELALLLWPGDVYTNEERNEYLEAMAHESLVNEASYVEGFFAAATELWSEELAPELEES